MKTRYFDYILIAFIFALAIIAMGAMLYNCISVLRFCFKATSP